jgi:DHA2 family multidrug resistance protein-like MFS transporter
VLAVIYAIKEFARGGFQWLPAAGVLAGLGVSAAFVRRQMTLANPLIDLRLFLLPGFSVALAINLLVLLAFDGAFLLIAQYLQLVAGLSPWQAALWTLPWAGGVIAGSMAGPFLVRWVRPRFVIVPGLVVAAGGFGLLTQAAGASLALIAVGSMLSSLGVGPAVALSTDLVVGAVSAERAGVASGMTETSTELGGALGIAIVGSVSIAVYRSALVVPSAVPPGSVAAVRDTLGGALAVAANLPAPSGGALSVAAGDAFTQGLHVGALVSTAVAIGLAVLATAMLERKESDR